MHNEVMVSHFLLSKTEGKSHVFSPFVFGPVTYQALPALNTCLSFAVANCSEFSEGKISAKRKSQITIGEKAKVVMMRKL